MPHLCHATPPQQPVPRHSASLHQPAHPPATSTGHQWHLRPQHQPLDQSPPRPPGVVERSYWGPRPTIPDFRRRDPGEFTRLKIAQGNLQPADATELFKYQVLVEHLKLEEACLVAVYLHSPTPYTDTMAALNKKFSQPHHLALKKIASVMDSPGVHRGDTAAFEKFALQVQSLVGMLKTLGSEGDAELRYGSHVACLLGKLPPELRAEFRCRMFHRPDTTYTLLEFSEWLQYESWCQEYDGQSSSKVQRQQTWSQSDGQSGKRTATVLHEAREVTLNKDSAAQVSTNSPPSSKRGKPKPYCPYCENSDYFLSQCPNIKKLTKEQVAEWIQSKRKCWRCGRPHQAAQCDLRKPCEICQGKHLQVLHKVNDRKPKEAPPETSCLVSTTADVLYLDKPADASRVPLKVIKVILHQGDCTLDTFAILDDRLQRTMLLSAAAQKLGLKGTPEDLALRTIEQDIQTLQGSSVSFHISSASQPKRRFLIRGVFTASRLSLEDHSYPITSLQKKYKHLSGLPLQQFDRAKPLILIGADHPHLLTPIEPVRLGLPGGPAAIRTRLGRTLQGLVRLTDQHLKPHQCLFTSTMSPTSELMKNVEKL